MRSALSAFIKVPLIIGAGGNAAYAAVTLVLRAWAITAALADGLGQTLPRVMLAERGIGQSERVRRLVGGAASGEALVMTLVAVVGFVVLLAIGHSTELWLLYFGFAIVCPGVSYAKGILEASDRTALSNATLATNVIVSLAARSVSGILLGGGALALCGHARWRSRTICSVRLSGAHARDSDLVSAPDNQANDEYGVLHNRLLVRERYGLRV